MPPSLPASLASLVLRSAQKQQKLASVPSDTLEAVVRYYVADFTCGGDIADEEEMLRQVELLFLVNARFLTNNQLLDVIADVFLIYMRNLAFTLDTIYYT